MYNDVISFIGEYYTAIPVNYMDTGSFLYSKIVYLPHNFPYLSANVTIDCGIMENHFPKKLLGFNEAVGSSGPNLGRHRHYLV